MEAAASKYDQQDLDYYAIWCNAEIAIYILHFGEKYKVETYILVKGIAFPTIQPIEYHSVERLLKLIDKLGLEPTVMKLRLVADEEDYENS
jgi:hypothetical protein